MSVHPEHFIRNNTQPLDELMNKTAELERKLEDVRMSLEFGLIGPAGALDTSIGSLDEACGCPAHGAGYGDGRGYRHGGGDVGYGPDEGPVVGVERDLAASVGYGAGPAGDERPGPQWRTEELLTKGRQNSFRPGLSRGSKIAIAALAAALAVTIAVLILGRGGPSWPASVATVEREAAKACQNPDVKSEPGQINFACAKGTRQILWVFALLTSGANPSFNDTKTRRLGLEPITPAQGSQIAWSLNLHHPYNPFDPIDSLQVAARAINNIIGGATLTGANGRPIVQPGLESSPENCLRYTGSAAVKSHQGYPRVCAKPVSSPAGQAALVADVFQKWIVGAPPRDAQAAAVLFQNADDPGNPQVQAILKDLPRGRLA